MILTCSTCGHRGEDGKDYAHDCYWVFRERGKNARCDGRYPVPGPRDEPFEVTYRCAMPTGHDGPHGGDYPTPEGTQELGSRFASVGPVTIGCMAKDSRDALDLAMERWRKHAAEREREPDDPVYSFAYWLFRWSGIVTGVNLDAPENPWTKAPCVND